MTLQRKFVVVLLSLAIIVFGGVAFLAVSLDPEAIKERLENHIADSFGLQVRMQGTIDLHFLPPGASFTDITIRSREREILTVKRIRTGIALLPLLRKEVQLKNLALYEPILSLRRDQSGTLPFGDPEKARGPFAVGGISVRDGTVRYSDAANRVEMEWNGLDLEFEDLRRDEAGNFSFIGGFRAGHLGIGKVEMLDLSGSMSGKGNLFRIEPLRCGLFGSQARGKLEVDLRGAHPVWRGTLFAGKLSLAELSRALAGRPFFEGTVEIQAVLSGEGPGRIVDKMDGTVRMSGKDLIQHGFDLDRFVRNFRASRNIDLVDIGLYAFAGPVGALVSEGVAVAGMVLAAHSEERQVIEELVFNWSLQDGVARTEDVAFRTRENRMAFQGAIDLSRGRYDGLTVGLLNAKGCAEMTERISGPLHAPSVEKASIVGTLADSLIGILRQGWEIIDFRTCRPFYEGTVVHPREGGKGKE